MPSEDLILATELCNRYNIEVSFIDSLQQFGLIDTVFLEETSYITHAQLPRLEQLARLHYDLNINIEGLDAVIHLLRKIDDLQSQLVNLKNRVSFYEGYDG